MRIVLRNPELLILDEATANIDTVTEQLLEDILKKLPETTTRVIIAHRLNTIENADEIFFVNSGEITPRRLYGASRRHALAWQERKLKRCYNRAMKKFKLSHSLLGTIVLLVAQVLIGGFFPSLSVSVILCGAIIGGVMTLYIATEVIEEVRNNRHMLLLLSAVVTQSVIFFSFQYWYLLIVEPQSFPPFLRMR